MAARRLAARGLPELGVGIPPARQWRIGLAVGAMLVLASIPGRAADLPNACDATDPPANKPFDVYVGGEIDTDYVYRGVTLSAHQPAMGASLEVDRGSFYFKFEPHSVKLPNNPSAEIGLSGGWCKQVVDKIKIDLGVSYLYYPGEVPVGPVVSTSYAEPYATVSYDPTKLLNLSATYAYAPNYSNSGAWQHYVEGGFEIHLEKAFPKLLPKDLGWSISGAVGRSWFGTQSPALGGFPLPAYTNWWLDLSFSYDPFTLDFVYSNTNLTKENCFVFTGDPGAAPGGVIDPVKNPMGLRSSWCGAAFVGSLSYEFSPGK